MKRERSLAAQLALIGLAQVALIALAAVLIAWVTRAPPHPHDMRGAVRDAAAQLEALQDRGEPLDDAVERLADELRLELTVRDKNDRVITSTVDPPLEAPEEARAPCGDPRARRHRGRRGRLGHRGQHHRHRRGHRRGHRAHSVEKVAGQSPWYDLSDASRPPRRATAVSLGRVHVLIARAVEPPPRYLAALLILLLGVIVVGVGAVLTARWIVRPLRRLAGAAKRVGEGDFAARASLDRRDEIGTVGRSFDDMAERVERLIRAERDLLANVSHELRTPLARIRVAMDLAAEQDPPSAQAAVVGIAEDLAELEAIIDDILLAMRFEAADDSAVAGLPIGALEDVPPERVAERAVERFAARHPDRELIEELGAGTSVVRADANMLRRVLDNLLENAHKYTPDPDMPITLRLRREPDAVIFEVEDTGIGIAEDDAPRVFEPFFRTERSRSRDAGGVGLGLTLARRIVEAHGGTLEVDSVRGAGSTFRIRLDATEP